MVGQLAQLSSFTLVLWLIYLERVGQLLSSVKLTDLSVWGRSHSISEQSDDLLASIPVFPHLLVTTDVERVVSSLGDGCLMLSEPLALWLAEFALLNCL